MSKQKILRSGWKGVPTAFYVGAMRTTDGRNTNQETENLQWLAIVQTFHQTFQTLDDAYQRSLASLLTKSVGVKDEERDVYGQVMEQVAKQWARLPDPALAIYGQRVYNVFTDIVFRTSEALVAENEKILNIEQRFQEPELQAALTAMGLTPVNQKFNQLTHEIINLMSQRSEEEAELKAAREAMDVVYADYVELTNALIVTGAAPELESLAAVLNADYKKIEDQQKQSKSLPTVLVDSKVVGNHRYSVPEYSTWQTIVEQNEKAFAIDASTNRIVSLAAKASKVGGLYLTLNGVAVKPTDAVDAKKEYTLAYVKPQPEPTPVEPE